MYESAVPPALHAHKKRRGAPLSRIARWFYPTAIDHRGSSNRLGGDCLVIALGAKVLVYSIARRVAFSSKSA